MQTTSHQPGSSIAPTPEMQHDAVRASQHIFRVLLDAMSHPGRTWQLIPHPHIAMEPDLPYPWLASILTTLIDHEVSLHIVDAPGINEMLDTVSRRTRAELVGIDSAEFVAADIAHLDPAILTRMKIGSLDYPDDGATLVLQVQSLTSDSGPRLRLSGPGILDEISIAAGDLSPELIDARNSAVRDYPLGIDLFVVDANGLVMSFPRTTAITIQEGSN